MTGIEPLSLFAKWIRTKYNLLVAQAHLKIHERALNLRSKFVPVRSFNEQQDRWIHELAMSRLNERDGKVAVETQS